jgi:SAM-dependent methyltransferase
MTGPPHYGPKELRRISAVTLDHYRTFADDYRAGTWDHDVSQNIQALLGAIGGDTPLRILDLGCGPGRDLTALRDLGHEVVGLDGCPEFVSMAREVAGCDVWLQDLLALDLPPRRFDGVFAYAVLFHVPSQVLPRVLAKLHATLTPGGVLFCSNPRGRTRRAGRAIVMPASTMSRPGSTWSVRPASRSSTSTTVRPASRGLSSPGSRRCGAGRSIRPRTT